MLVISMTKEDIRHGNGIKGQGGWRKNGEGGTKKNWRKGWVGLVASHEGWLVPPISRIETSH